MRQEILDKKLLLRLCMVFLIIQPILDIYVLFEPEVIAFFHFSPSTIIRIGLMGILILLFPITVKWEKKHLWIVVYLVLVLIYTFFHHQNALQFHSNTEGDFNYSLVSELFYIIRMLLPLAMILISNNLKLNKKQMETIITWLVILVSGSIVITNLLGIGINSYTNNKIVGSILDWFIKDTISYRLYASKGFFMYANQIAALELLLTPLLFYFMIQKPNVKNIFLVILQLLAAFMLGTKVAGLGFIILLVLMILLYGFFYFLKKEVSFSWKRIFVFGLLIISCIILLPISPMTNRENLAKKTTEKPKTEKTCQELNFDLSNPYEYQATIKKIKVDIDEKCKTQSDIENEKIEVVEEQMSKLETNKEKTIYLNTFVKKEYGNFNLIKDFVEDGYPYQYDPNFWYEIMKGPSSERVNYRILEEKMLKRVKSINNNPKDDWLGITYSRMSNIFNLERDFLSHYYSMGWIGVVLFLSPYVIVLLVGIILMLRYFKTKVTFYHCTLALSLGITLFAAFYSGNVMDGLVVSLILGFMMGQFIQRVKPLKTKQNKKISVIMPTYNDSKTIKKSLDSLMKQTYSNWELIIVDDGSIDDTKTIIKEYQKQYDKENRIQYLYQKNSDQLKAIIHGTEKITGDYVFVLHSDDLLATIDVFTKAVQYMEEHQELDAIIAPLTIINEKGRITGYQDVLSYTRKKKIPVLQMLWLGRNLYVDVGFFKKDSYLTTIKENYLTWNMPFWLNYNKNVEMLNVETVDFELLKYRIHSGNYINNEIGKLNVLNGELRTITTLMQYYDISDYEKQYTKFRIFAHLHLLNIYKPKYELKESKHKSTILDFVIKKRFPEGYENNIYLNSLVEFYKNKKKRKIEFSKIYHGEEIYTGNQARKFNKQIIANELPQFYQTMLEEMRKGFDEMIVENKEDMEKAQRCLRFLCIDSDVSIIKE